MFVHCIQILCLIPKIKLALEKTSCVIPSFYWLRPFMLSASVAQLDAHLTVDQGPVVQSVVSLTSSLRVISLTVLVDSIYNILIFFAEKM